MRNPETEKHALSRDDSGQSTEEDGMKQAPEATAVASRNGFAYR
mgnify:CR=1 FL=1